MKTFRLLFAVVALGVAPFAEAQTKPAAISFLRTVDAAGKTRALQTASVEYQRAKGAGPGVWLIGVAHLGSAEYFQAIQQRLDRQTVVLYEGVGVTDLKRGPGAATESAGLQAKLASALGLKFQLDVIDYRSPHFINSDLRVPELEEQVRKHAPEESGPAKDQLFGQLMDALQGTGMAGGAMNQMVGMLGASTQMQEMTKMMLVEVLSQAGEFLELAKSVSPEMKDLFDVLLTERNAIVIADLRAQLARLKPGESIAIFYGAAHMDELAAHLKTDLGYLPVDTRWDTAFAADPAQSGINPAQVQLMLGLLRAQLKAPPAK